MSNADRPRSISWASPIPIVRVEGDDYYALHPLESGDLISFLRSPICAGLVQKGMVLPQELRPGKTSADGELLLRAPEFPFRTYPFEWTASAFKEAAEFILRFNLELVRGGFITASPSLWNVQFAGPQPIFENLREIVKINQPDARSWLEAYRTAVLNPLKLLADSQHQLARMFIMASARPNGGPDERDINRLTDTGLLKRYLALTLIGKSRTAARLYKRLKRPRRKKALDPEAAQKPATATEDLAKSLAALLAETRSIAIRARESWDYYGDYFQFPSFEDRTAWTAKNRAVDALLDEVRPAKVVDIGSNRGWYSLLAAHKGAEVASLDKEELLADQLFLSAREMKLGVHPLVVDFLWPSPSGGLFGQILPLVGRLENDLVLALALVHHLVHRNKLTFESIVDGLSRFSGRYLLTEFVAYGDSYLSEWCEYELDWYSLENFIAALEEKFKVISILESDPQTRKLIFCEKR